MEWEQQNSDLAMAEIKNKTFCSFLDQVEFLSATDSSCSYSFSLN